MSVIDDGIKVVLNRKNPAVVSFSILARTPIGRGMGPKLACRLRKELFG